MLREPTVVCISPPTPVLGGIGSYSLVVAQRLATIACAFGALWSSDEALFHSARGARSAATTPVRIDTPLQFAPSPLLTARRPALKSFTLARFLTRCWSNGSTASGTD